MDADDEPGTGGNTLEIIVGFLVLRTGRIPINLFEEFVLLMLIKLRKTKPRFYSSREILKAISDKSYFEAPLLESDIEEIIESLRSRLPDPRLILRNEAGNGWFLNIDPANIEIDLPGRETLE